MRTFLHFGNYVSTECFDGIMLLKSSKSITIVMWLCICSSTGQCDLAASLTLIPVPGAHQECKYKQH